MAREATGVLPGGSHTQNVCYRASLCGTVRACNFRGGHSRVVRTLGGGGSKNVRFRLAEFCLLSSDLLRVSGWSVLGSGTYLLTAR